MRLGQEGKAHDLRQLLQKSHVRQLIVKSNQFTQKKNNGGKFE